MRLAALMAAIGALLATGSVQAQTPPPSALGMFRALCVDTGAKPGPSLSSPGAIAAGWGELDEQTATRFQGLKAAFPDALMRLRHVGPGMIVAFSGVNGQLPGVQFTASNNACGIMSINTGADDSDVQTRTAKWLGAKGPSYTLGAASIYTYTDKDGAKTLLNPAADDAEIKKASAEGRLNLVFVQSQGAQTLFFYLISNPVN
jgi:hypothetical protein